MCVHQSNLNFILFMSLHLKVSLREQALSLACKYRKIQKYN